MPGVGWNSFAESRRRRLFFRGNCWIITIGAHRRILVIDGRIGFTGGYGIADSWIGDGRTAEHWRDTNARIEGLAFALNQELNLTMYDAPLARHLEEIFQADLKHSKNITYEEWNSRTALRILHLSSKRAAVTL